MMSTLRWTKSSVRMWAMFASEPVSRLSTQITRWPRASSSSHRCEPRKPAPPVTRQVGMSGNLAAGLQQLLVERQRGLRDPAHDRLLAWTDRYDRELDNPQPVDVDVELGKQALRRATQVPGCAGELDRPAIVGHRRAVL